VSPRSADFTAPATKKYVEPLLSIFGDRLLFPTAFAGTGAMKRGSLLLRAVATRTPLTYGRVAERCARVGR
jgi:hypothetical protein